MTDVLMDILSGISTNRRIVSFKSERVELPKDLPVTTADIEDSVKAPARPTLSSINGGSSNSSSSYNSNSSSNNISDAQSVIQKKTTGIDVSRVRLKPIGQRGTSAPLDIADGETYDKAEHDNELQQYRVESLNVEQREIWNFINSNRNKIVLIQAGPGCGKSYTLKTIAYNMKNIKFDTIIYKLDLLAAFKYNSRRFTVAKFVMQMLGLGFYQYQALDKLLSSKITAYEFMLVVTAMLKKATMPNMKGGIVFLDEYTIVSKPILLVTLMLLEYHQIGAIICGDRNQLQNIFNSRHAKLSSYRLAASFSTRQFQLHVNERCSDAAYNEIVEFISQFSSSQRLDEYAFAIVSAIFLRQLIEPPNYHQVHLAGTHQELSALAHTLVCNNSYPTDFYSIDQSKLRDKNSMVRAKPELQATQALIDYTTRIQNGEPPRVDKFLPYIPLVLNGRYYVFKHSEYSCGRLKAIQPDDTLVMEMENGKTIVVGRDTNDGAIFDEHRKFLLNGELGKLYSYPIYPTEFMSIHMCQGCTIRDNLDLILNNTQYQGLYVAMSRVTTPSQIARVSIPDQISYIVSSIINFPKHITGEPITVDDLKRALNNYVFYNVNRHMDPFLPLIHDFIMSDNPKTKELLRDRIITLAREYPQVIISLSGKQNDDNASNLLTMSLVIKYREVFLALACLDELDRNVWLHEYILANPELRCLLPEDFEANSERVDHFQTRYLNELIRLADLNYAYTMEMSTIEYIVVKSKTSIRLGIEDQAKHRKYMVKEAADCVFFESSEFCAKIYNRLVDSSSSGGITEQWLIDELNEMITKFGNDTVEQPTKTTPTKRTAAAAAAGESRKPPDVTRKFTQKRQRRLP